MMPKSVWFICLCILAAPSSSSLTYAPIIGICPVNAPTVRGATSLSNAETQYASYRYSSASTALTSWLKSLNRNFATTNLPVLGLATSGGGYRSMLSGAGIVQAFDTRDSNLATSGLYQALSYHSGLSGGSWLLSALAGNNFPTITELTRTYWNTEMPNNPLSLSLSYWQTYLQVIVDIILKIQESNNHEIPGIYPTFTDLWGRLLSYGLLPKTAFTGPGANLTFSSITTLSNFTGYNAPFPIITALGVNTWEGFSMPLSNATQYEISPFEFGSWDDGVAAFAPTSYIGTPMSKGAPSNLGTCVTNADNLGWLAGTSSNLFNTFDCGIGSQNPLCPLIVLLEAQLATYGYNLSLADASYANYTNPFFGYPASKVVDEQPILNLVDGGEANQNNPIWPFLQQERNVSVLIVNDNSADTGSLYTGGYPNGSEIHNTYIQAQTAGLTKMPIIPDPQTFLDKYLNQNATFFGCDDPDKLTIIYLPNYNWTYTSGTPTWQFTYTPAEIEGIISNGNAIATQNGDPEWPICLACAVTLKTGVTQPDECAKCLQRYCWRT